MIRTWEEPIAEYTSEVVDRCLAIIDECPDEYATSYLYLLSEVSVLLSWDYLIDLTGEWYGIPTEECIIISWCDFFIIEIFLESITGHPMELLPEESS